MSKGGKLISMCAADLGKWISAPDILQHTLDTKSLKILMLSSSHTGAAWRSFVKTTHLNKIDRDEELTPSILVYFSCMTAEVVPCKPTSLQSAGCMLGEANTREVLCHVSLSDKLDEVRFSVGKMCKSWTWNQWWLDMCWKCSAFLVVVEFKVFRSNDLSDSLSSHLARLMQIVESMCLDMLQISNT